MAIEQLTPAGRRLADEAIDLAEHRFDEPKESVKLIRRRLEHNGRADTWRLEPFQLVNGAAQLVDLSVLALRKTA